MNCCYAASYSIISIIYIILCILTYCYYEEISNTGKVEYFSSKVEVVILADLVMPILVHICQILSWIIMYISVVF